MLPDSPRLLLGPGPSPVSPRVMRAMAAPVLSHLDPSMMALLDDLRSRLTRVFRAGPDAFAFAVSGTGTSGMECAVANLAEGRRALAVVTGYFGDRLAQMLERHGAEVTRLDVEWGRACDPDAVGRAIDASRAEIVALVHAETSTGVLNPLADVARIARDRGALTIADAVTSLGAHPLDVGAWNVDACYSCTQKGLGAPSGLAPIVFSGRALESRRRSRSYSFDVALLEDYWLRRKYHHTISAPLVYALAEALAIVEEEGLEVRWARHERHHCALAAALEAMGLRLLPPPHERLWTLNAVCVPPGVDEAAVRRHLLERSAIEIGAGLGPLAGRIWRVGLMGSGSTEAVLLQFLGAFERALLANGFRLPAGAAAQAAVHLLH
jgi:alanine-glyoxylate transaminase / serine-glyoxylate transaminase / serine-pyruvate transaminase